MTGREGLTLAFAVAVAGLAVVIVVGHVSIQVGPSTHLPALNGTPPPRPTPGSVGAPAPQPAPTGSVPPMQAPRTQLSSTGGQQSGGHCRPSTSNGDSPSGSSGSTAQNLLPPGLGLPIAMPSPAPLPVLTP